MTESQYNEVLLILEDLEYSISRISSKTPEYIESDRRVALYRLNILKTYLRLVNQGTKEQK